MRNSWGLVITCALVLVSACGENGDRSGDQRSGPAPVGLAAGGIMTGEDVLELLMNDDEAAVVDGLNEIKRRGVSADALAILEAVWLREVDAYPDLAWVTLAAPLVRVNVVDILIQAERNGYLREEPVGAHEYVRTLVREAEPRVVSQGVITLAMFGLADDVPLIEEVGTHNEEIFRSSVIALSTMCTTAADEALDRLESLVTGPSRTFVRDTSTRMSAYKERSGQCR